MVHSVNQTGNMFSTHSTEWALNYQETVGPYGIGITIMAIYRTNE